MGGRDVGREGDRGNGWEVKPGTGRSRLALGGACWHDRILQQGDGASEGWCSKAGSRGGTLGSCTAVCGPHSVAQCSAVRCGASTSVPFSRAC